jgi:hypothetical protein
MLGSFWGARMAAAGSSSSIAEKQSGYILCAGSKIFRYNRIKLGEFRSMVVFIHPIAIFDVFNSPETVK